MTISICIPTYNRPDNLAGAIASCLDQTLLPTEILIGDDSPDNKTADFINDFTTGLPVNIRYFKNTPPLKQSNNVRFLFSKAITELLVLLHDDDRLLPDALEKLRNCFLQDPSIDIAYGKQYFMNDADEIDPEFSEKMNTLFFRSFLYAGTKLTSLEAGFLQQVPSDGYMARTRVVETVNYSGQLKDAGDFEFGLRLGLNGFKMYFLNDYTAKYRLSNNSNRTKKNNDAAIAAYNLVHDLKVPESSAKLKAAWLESKAPVAIAQACNLKQGKAALKIFFSKYHQNKIFTPGGLKRLFMIGKALLVNSK